MKIEIDDSTVVAIEQLREDRKKFDAVIRSTGVHGSCDFEEAARLLRSNNVLSSFIAQKIIQATDGGEHA